MGFRSNTHKLVARICDYYRERNLPAPGQTRITKLMYLIEWEYFAWERERLTSLDWIYLHYGPWSQNLSTILEKEFKAPDEEVGPGKFRQVYWTPPEYDYVDTRFKGDLEGIVERVLETFGPLGTEDIIRYVYFNTEPMQHAKRKQPLDFGKTRKPVKPFNPVKVMGKNLRQSLRDRLKAATSAKLAEKPEPVGTVSPEVLEMLSRFDSGGDLVLPEGEVQIGNQDRLNIADEG